MERINEKLTDAQLIHRELQSAIDHYPRLAAFRFSLQQPEPDERFLTEEIARYTRQHPVSANAWSPASVLAFHADVGHRFDDYVQARTAAGKPSPPTLLRWVWETGHALPCRMLLLFNLATCHHPRQGTGSVEEELKAAASLLSEAWNDVCPSGELTGMTFFRVERTRSEVFGGQYAALREAASQLAFPVATTRSGQMG